MSTVTTLILVQQSLTRYLLSTILIMGNIGNLIAICIFAQKKHRTNSCPIYLMAVSVFGLIAANWAIAPLVYALDHFDVVNSSVILCRVRGYIIHVNSMCFRYTILLMCADRYALCNSRTSIRALCRPQIAYRSIGILVLFWMIASVHLPILQSIENNRCAVFGLYGQIMGFYSLIFSGTIPLLTMIVLSIKLMKNLRQIRSRIQPLDGTRQLNRRDVKLIKLVLVEVFVYILCTFGYPCTTIYLTLTNSIVLNKSAKRRQIESFVNFITMSLLFYLNYNTTFYTHILTSTTYRMEVKQLVVHLIRELRKIVSSRENGVQRRNQIATPQPVQTTSAV